jgi:hypothetical protein
MASKNILRLRQPLLMTQWKELDWQPSEFWRRTFQRVDGPIPTQGKSPQESGGFFIGGEYEERTNPLLLNPGFEVDY